MIFYYVLSYILTIILHLKLIHSMRIFKIISFFINLNLIFLTKNMKISMVYIFFRKIINFSFYFL